MIGSRLEQFGQSDEKDKEFKTTKYKKEKPIKNLTYKSDFIEQTGLNDLHHMSSHVLSSL